VSDGMKSKVFGLLFVIASVGGMATVFSGPVIERFGLVSSLRVLYGCAFAAMTGMFFFRHAILTETRAGAELTELHAEMTFKQTFRRGLAVVVESMKNRKLFRLILAYVVFCFALAMGFVQILFINNEMKLTLTEISMLPPVAAVISVVLFRWVVPRICEANERRMLVWSLVIFSFGLCLLPLIPPGNLAWVLLASGLSAAGAYLFQVAANAAMNNAMGSSHKADIYSIVQLLVALVTIPAGYLVGCLFVIRPALAIGLPGLIGFVAAGVILLPCKQRVAESGEADSSPACKSTAPCVE
jgi:hypothetical protein